MTAGGTARKYILRLTHLSYLLDSLLADKRTAQKRKLSVGRNKQNFPIRELILGRHFPYTDSDL